MKSTPRTPTGNEQILLDALRMALELLNEPSVRFKICDFGRGNLGQQSRYMRAKQAATRAIDKVSFVEPNPNYTTGCAQHPVPMLGCVGCSPESDMEQAR